MSIYATWLSLDNDHEDDCAIYVEVSPGVLEFGDKPCDCGTPQAPFAYQGSHVLPARTDPRGGAVDVAAIPNHITRDGRDDGSEGLHDWLRLSVFGAEKGSRAEDHVGYGVVLLDRDHVARLRDTLTEWLDAEERY